MTRAEVTAYIGLGANLGDAAHAVRCALQSLRQTAGIRQVRASSLYRSAPVDSSGPDYINAVAEVTTTLTAPGLLCALQRIEQAAGRERPYLNAPRTLDLDVLLYGDARITSPHLTVRSKRSRRVWYQQTPWALWLGKGLRFARSKTERLQGNALTASNGLVVPPAATFKTWV